MDILISRICPCIAPGNGMSDERSVGKVLAKNTIIIIIIII
jgi:hypothetical protein